MKPALIIAGAGHIKCGITYIDALLFFSCLHLQGGYRSGQQSSLFVYAPNRPRHMRFRQGG